MIVTAGAAEGLERCRLFLGSKNPLAAQRAASVIKRQLAMLGSMPDIGRPWSYRPELREVVIAFGDAGYTALYRHDIERDAVLILAFRHQREAGY